MSLSLVDRSAKVAEDRFDSSTQVGGGSVTVVAAITSLIQGSLPGVPVVDRTGSTQVAPLLDIERERWADGVEKLADSIGAEVFADPLGSFEIRPQPKLTDPPQWVIASGARGILISRDEKRTRELVYNRVVVSGARSDGTPPVLVVVSDTDPNSPTFYGGTFGRKPRFYTSPLITTTAQGQTTGVALLERVKGMQGSGSITSIVNPALDGGDVFHLRDRTVRQALILDKTAIPLTPGDAQPITVRAVDLPPEQ